MFPAFLFDSTIIGYNGLDCLRFSNQNKLFQLIELLKSKPDVVEDNMIKTRAQITVTEGVAELYRNVIRGV